MRLMFDATAVPLDRRGVGRYVDSLLPELERLGVDLQIVVQARDVKHYAQLCPESLLVPAPSAISRRPARLLWEQTGLPGLVRRHRPDLLHSPHYTRPLLVDVPSVVTLHDATFFSHPEVHQRTKRVLFTAWSRLAPRIADRCIVPSAATRDELVKYTGADPGLIDVAHLGVDHRMFHPPTPIELAAARRSVGVEGPYVAFLGTIEPRKNLPALIEAYGSTAPPDWALVIAGGSGWDDTVEQAAARVPDTVRVVRPGYLPAETLAGFLGGAHVVAYPSLGEGFGLPVAEAMACGTAVLTTRELALPEVGGDAALYTGTDAESIADGLRRLFSDDALRAELVERGRRQASQFTWTAAAEKHLATYERVLDRSTR